MITGNNYSQDQLFEWLKVRVKATDLGPGGSLVLFDVVPKNVERWLKRDAKKRGYHLHFGGGAYRTHITTKAQSDAAAEQYREASLAEQDRINSPG